jgi:hypothetical protein
MQYGDALKNVARLQQLKSTACQTDDQAVALTAITINQEKVKYGSKTILA